MRKIALLFVVGAALGGCWSYQPPGGGLWRIPQYEQGRPG